MEDIILRTGDVSENGRVTIVDEDKLCYLAKSESRGSKGVRTISKALLKEFIEYVKEHPDAAPRDAKNALSGKSDIDKYEYAYDSTLVIMAKMVINKEKSYPHENNIHVKYRNNCYRPYLTAIKSKPFLLLAGISGTGKSRIVRELARACWGFLELMDVLIRTHNTTFKYPKFGVISI